MTALATKAGVSVETVRKLTYGVGRASSATISAVAGALGVDVRVVARWATEQRAVSEPFEMPAEADLLTDRERRAVIELVRAITADRKAGENRGNTAPIDAAMQRRMRRGIEAATAGLDEATQEDVPRAALKGRRVKEEMFSEWDRHDAKDDEGPEEGA